MKFQLQNNLNPRRAKSRSRKNKSLTQRTAHLFVSVCLTLATSESTEAGCFEKHQFKKIKHVFKLGGQTNVVIEWKASKKNKILDTVYEVTQVPEKYLEDIFMFLAAAKNLIAE